MKQLVVLAILAFSYLCVAEKNNETVVCGAFNNDCGKCSEVPQCLWCQKNGTCVNVTEAATMVCEQFGYCNGESCTCSIFPTTSSIGSMLMMIVIYGLFLGFAAKMIADGSELLLEIFPHWGTIIGGLLLPILGALPDGAMILVSGAFGSAAEAQEQVSVGVGTLAGSTIMLLTIPWAASIWVGRSDIVNGESVDKQLTVTGAAQFTQTGVTVDRDTIINARIALVASLAFFICQGIAFAYLKDESEGRAIEDKLALAGFVICTLAFVAYCVYQIIVPKLAEKRLQKAEQYAEERRMRLRALHVVSRMRKHTGLTEVHTEESVPAIPISQEAKQEQSNAAALAAGLMWKRRAAQKAAVTTETAPLLREEAAINKIEKEIKREEDSDSDSGDEKKGEPSFGKTLAKSLAFMLGGAALVAFFSDPMVDVINTFGNTIGVPAFYVSFLITPFCSNASELIASIQFAAKKRKASSSMTFSQLYGAATMNCTFGLAIFYALIYFRQLTWTFSAETLTILFVSWCVCGVGAIVPTLRVWYIIPNLMLYPFSLFFVYALKNWAGWQ